MIGIKAIGIYVPENRISNITRAFTAGKDEAFVANKIGFTSVARRENGEDTSDLCVKAWQDLAPKVAVGPEEVDCVVVCTQNPDAHGLPHTSAIVHRKLALGANVACFDISLGCSGYVYGLSIIKSFMETQGLKCGLLFTADPYSKILDPQDWDTELLFGDGAAVTLLTTEPVYRLRGGSFATEGSLGHSIEVREAGGRLSMLGNNVFKFAMTVVPEQLGSYLAKENLAIEDIPLFLFHQGSRFIVENLAKRLRIPLERAPFEAAEIGNTVSSTLPIMLASRIDSGTPPERVLLCGFGVGLSWATMVIDRV